MKAFEYLQKNIKKEYSFYPGTVISLTTKDAVTPFKLNGKEYCTGRTKIGNQYYNFLKDESSDGAIFSGLPDNIYKRIEYPILNTIAQRIQDKIMIFAVSHAEMQQTKTELVQLRIANSMIMNLKCLSSDDRILWANWIKELYWERKKILHRWYLEYVLPF